MQWAAGVGVLLLAGCVNSPTRGWEGPRPVVEVERWEARSEAKRLGSVLLLEIGGAGSGVRFYQVQNARGQWLGYIDLQGRVYQRVPFSMTETFRGIHGMEKALALLYEEAGQVWLSSPGPRPVKAAAVRGR